jgi:sulfide dehydrogenase [flavocytochrome c] flavoprotein subunit
MSRDHNRREALKLVAMAGLAGLVPAVLPGRALAQATGRVVIVGGGFGGGTCARTLARLAPALSITLIEQNPSYITCPFSNGVIAGIDDIAAITHEFGAIEAAGVTRIQDRAVAIDPDRKEVRLAGGEPVPYDRLVLSPGIDFKWDAIEGYDEAASQVMPHAWKAGPQTLLLRSQIEAMEDGGVVVMTIPPTPFRCPPGPYERASLIAHYLKTNKPRSKIILVDANDGFSKQGLFREGWAALYPDQLEWIPFSQAGGLLSVDPQTLTIETDFETVTGAVINIIPPQRAGAIAVDAGLADGGDWCPIDSASFESRVIPGIHVLGDSAIAGAMPKSGFSAGAQGKVCARAIAALMSGESVGVPSFINTCYSLVAPDYGISVADVFRVGEDGAIAAVQGAGGVSPTGQSAEVHALEAEYARGWYASITTEIYG